MSELGQPLPVGAIAHLTCGWSLHLQRDVPKRSPRRSVGQRSHADSEPPPPGSTAFASVAGAVGRVCPRCACVPRRSHPGAVVAPRPVAASELCACHWLSRRQYVLCGRGRSCSLGSIAFLCRESPASAYSTIGISGVTDLVQMRTVHGGDGSQPCAIHRRTTIGVTLHAPAALGIEVTSSACPASLTGRRLAGDLPSLHGIKENASDETWAPPTIHIALGACGLKTWPAAALKGGAKVPFGGLS